jgi:5,10-methylenetetrahydromethanopterin reductase
MIRLSCGLPPSRDVVEHARVAEDLGYERVWLFDSPALYGDIWAGLARVADATERIGLGTAVAVPSLRHVMVTASAIATVAELAPGRLVCAFGSGFTARMALGRRAMRWADVGEYVSKLRTLLAGGTVEVDGGMCRMIHSPGYAPPRPIDVPLLVAPAGEKGFAIAREVGDGVVLIGLPPEPPTWPTCALLVYGTVLDDGEDHLSPRVRAAAGPWYVTAYHGMWEWSPEVLDAMPGGAQWRAGIEAEPEGERHLAVHEGHVVTVTERDLPLLDVAGAGLLATGWTGDAASVAARAKEAADAGVTEIVYSPSGPDLRRELEAFAAALPH